MIELNQKYDRNQFLNFLKEVFLNDFQKDVRPIGSGNISAISRAFTLGTSPSLDLQVFEFEYSGSFNKRIALAKEAFQIMKQSATFQALAVFYSPENDDWRFSLMTANPQKNDKGNISVAYSNPRRYSFFLGPNAKVNTPTKYLIKKGIVVDFSDLKGRFSLEVVNKEFYKEISESFTKLIGGTRGEGQSQTNYESLLKLPSVNDHSQTSIEFGVRLIGRLIFCWFLKEKISKLGSPLMPKDLLSLEAISKNSDYYHRILEPIFFEILNKPIKSRRDSYASDSFSLIPYLNGGLFSPHDDDFFSYNEGKKDQYRNTVVIPDEWIKEFFSILETYNFTIDENTSIDEELSIDPEMLGRIFENLLAEINPETGDSARKSTGSYYTPRVIVDYMVDESLLLYLKQKTNIDEEKLKAIVSYDLSDDMSFPLSDDEKKDLIDAIETVKILDPACGSGAFPIGALQKIVFILQQIDPEGQIWFQKQIQHTSPEMRRVLEREFVHKNFDYIRKLGVIRENIYGIDIQPIATEISRLRCFLTLVVDERIDDSLDNRGVEPLPNLDFKFVTANSLIGLPGTDKKNQMGLFEDTEGITELREIRDMFFNAYGTEREQLKLQFVQSQNKMFQRLISENRRGHADLTTMLTTWDPFSHKTSSWFDPEWMFGMKQGFDIVIANPPYVSNKKMHKDKMQESIKKFKLTYLSMKSGNCDLYILFIEKALNLVKEGGIIKFIIPNKFLIAKYSKALLQHLIQNRYLTSIDDFSKTNVFNGVSVYPIVIELIKSNNESIKRREFYIEGGKMDIANEQSLNCKDLTFDNLLPSKKEQPLIDKIFDQSVILGDVVSVMPGINGFQFTNYGRCIFDGVPDGKEELPRKRVIISGSIDRYIVKNSAIKYNKRKLENPVIVYDGTIISPAKWKLFETPKIVIAGMAKKIEAYYDEKGELACGVNVYSVFESQDFKFLYLLAYLNSSLSSWLFRTLFYDKHLAGDYISINATLIKKLPIKNVEIEIQQEFMKLANQILNLKRDINEADTDALEKKIDKMFYELYGLTDDEIKIVEAIND